jgi:hypothetical protein
LHKNHSFADIRDHHDQRRAKIISTVTSLNEEAPMAKRVVSRKVLRAENEAAEALAEGADKTKVKKVPAKRKPKVPKVVLLKAFWGVFNQSMKRVALFEYADRKKADKKAEELSGNQKTPHFVQLVKEVIEA